jgi:membrane protein DedA with SNARE-associated domain
MPLLVLIVFVGSCFGMGYFIGRRLFQRSLLLIGFSSFCAAVVWPVILIAFTIHTGRQYQPYGPSDPVDAPINLLLVVLGIVIARRREIVRMASLSER